MICVWCLSVVFDMAIEMKDNIQHCPCCELLWLIHEHNLPNVTAIRNGMPGLQMRIGKIEKVLFACCAIVTLILFQQHKDIDQFQSNDRLGNHHIGPPGQIDQQTFRRWGDFEFNGTQDCVCINCEPAAPCKYKVFSSFSSNCDIADQLTVELQHNMQRRRPVERNPDFSRGCV